ncbi:MAG: NUDIX hydrolase [Maricaulaceae bacterium]|nr:NUDIX hydrolase [Maricaulaceae bacterium]
MSRGGARGPWRVHGVRTAFENPWITVSEYEVTRPDGVPGRYGVVSPANLAIAILPVHADGSVTFVGQHRFPTDRYEWELPEGGGPKADDPRDSARRELAEETGLRAAHWLRILDVDLSNSVTDEAGVGYIAWDLTQGEARPDGTEVLALRRLPFAEAVERAVAGEFRDLLTVAMLLKAHYMAQKGDLPDALARLLTAGEGPSL